MIGDYVLDGTRDGALLGVQRDNGVDQYISFPRTEAFQIESPFFVVGRDGRIEEFGGGHIFLAPKPDGDCEDHNALPPISPGQTPDKPLSAMLSLDDNDYLVLDWDTTGASVPYADSVATAVDLLRRGQKCRLEFDVTTVFDLVSKFGWSATVTHSLR